MNRSTGIIVILVALGFLYVYNTPGGLSKLGNSSSPGTGSPPPWTPPVTGTASYDPGIAAIQDAFLYSREPAATAAPITINTGGGPQTTSQVAPGYSSSPYQTALAGFGLPGQPGVPGQKQSPTVVPWVPGEKSMFHTGSNTLDSVLNVGSDIVKFLPAMLGL